MAKQKDGNPTGPFSKLTVTVLSAKLWSLFDESDVSLFIVNLNCVVKIQFENFMFLLNYAFYIFCTISSGAKSKCIPPINWNAPKWQDIIDLTEPATRSSLIRRKTDCNESKKETKLVALGQWFSTFFIQRPTLTTQCNITTPLKKFLAMHGLFNSFVNLH